MAFCSACGASPQVPYLIAHGFESDELCVQSCTLALSAYSIVALGPSPFPLVS